MHRLGRPKEEEREWEIRRGGGGEAKGRRIHSSFDLQNEHRADVRVRPRFFVHRPLTVSSIFETQETGDRRGDLGLGPGRVDCEDR